MFFSLLISTNVYGLIGVNPESAAAALMMVDVRPVRNFFT